MKTETVMNSRTGPHKFDHLDDPLVKDYLSDLSTPWKQFVNFICKTQDPSYQDEFASVKGIDYLDLEQYAKQGRKVIRTSKCCAILETEKESKQVLFACYIPNLTIRLLISPNDNAELKEDNKYADKALGNMITQLKTCWRVLPNVLNYRHTKHLYVRKFERFTCFLYLKGYSVDDKYGHKKPMKKRLYRLRQYNVNESSDVIRGLLDTFPIINHKTAKLKPRYEFMSRDPRVIIPAVLRRSNHCFC